MGKLDRSQTHCTLESFFDTRYGVCFSNLFSMAVPFGFVLAIQLIFIPKEEKLMADAFGNKYFEYKKRVKRWI